ncbi:MAG: class I SAM-dependent methyltransferase [Myxococcales bacterium]
MREGAPSWTAGWVAGLRGLAPILPRDARMVEDPYGARFAGEPFVRIAAAARRHPRLAPLLASLGGSQTLGRVLMMQLRTRALDDLLADFVRASGRQLVLLGAGYDARAWRLRDELAGVRVFEVDHPATQARKRKLLAEAGAPPAEVAFLAWNFEQQPLEALPAALRALGHDPSKRTLTIWEGVTNYLSAEAIDATVGTVRGYCAPGSLLGFTYADRSTIEHPRGWERLDQWLIARRGEPLRSGFDPAELPAWLRGRGFALQTDQSLADLARAKLPPRYQRGHVALQVRRVAIARAV